MHKADVVPVNKAFNEEAVNDARQGAINSNFESLHLSSEPEALIQRPYGSDRIFTKTKICEEEKVMHDPEASDFSVSKANRLITITEANFEANKSYEANKSPRSLRENLIYLTSCRISITN